VAADRDRRAVAATRRGLAAARVEPWVRVEHRPFEGTGPVAPGTLIITNPPYGHRLGSIEQLRRTYRALGDMMKQRAAGSTAWLLMGEHRLAREIGLRPSRKIVLFNGPIECRLARYELFDGPLPDRRDREPTHAPSPPRAEDDRRRG
jgi:putative N6-adenine-specific DNA methylase